MFWSVGWRLLRAEGFFCNLYILYGGLGIGKLQFLIKKKFNFFSDVIFFQFLVIKPWTRIGSGSVFILKCWIRMKWMRIRNPAGMFIPDPRSADPSNKGCSDCSVAWFSRTIADDNIAQIIMFTVYLYLYLQYIDPCSSSSSVQADPIAPPPGQDPAGGERVQPHHSLPLPDYLSCCPPSVQVSQTKSSVLPIYFPPFSLDLCWYQCCTSGSGSAS